MTKKELAERSGLIYSGKNKDGDDEFIGTDKQWNLFTEALETAIQEGEFCQVCEGEGSVLHVLDPDDTIEKKCICEIEE